MLKTSVVIPAKRLMKAFIGVNGKADSRRDVSVISESGLFDRDFYLRTYPDVAKSGMDPVEHYVRYGARENRDPSEHFSTKHYLENNPDVAASGINPLRHYSEKGRIEGRSPAPSTRDDSRAPNECVRAQAGLDSGKGSDGSKNSEEYALLATSCAFDESYYRITYPGVARKGVDPISHYIERGAAEFKRPNPFFDTKFYLERYPDVGRSGMNPLVHYLRHGWRELRDPAPDFETAWYWLLHMNASLNVGSPLEHYIAVGRGLGLSTDAGSMTAREKRCLGESVVALVLSDRISQRVSAQLSEYLIRKRAWDSAELVCRHLVAKEWNKAHHHGRLAEVLAAQEKRWQEIESLKAAIDVGGGNSDLYSRLGLAYGVMGRWAESADAYTRALEDDPSQSQVKYELGYALEMCADERALASYASAILSSNDDNVARFGVGLLHEARGRWEDARRAYAERLQEEPLDAHLHYRLGMAHDRCYSWAEAERSYSVAIGLDPTVAYWHYRLGFVRERIGNWVSAAESYRSAQALSSTEQRYWRYRHGYVLHRAGEYEQACRAYLGLEDGAVVTPQRAGDGSASGQIDSDPVLDLIAEALRSDSTRADWHYALAVHYERKCDWAKAAAAYRAAVDRSDLHKPEWYRQLGLALYCQGEYRLASEAFREMRIARAPYGVDSAWMESSPAEMLLLSYRQYIADLPIRERTIVYESYAGVTVGCNPLAIFHWIRARAEYADWTHVWVVDGRSKIPQEYRELPNVIFVERESDLYLRFLATASHLINNATFPTWFIRREEQIYLNTWHGTPLKTLGKDIKGSFMERKNTTRNFLQATHIISPNKHTTDVLLDRYEVRGLMTARVAETGYPRIDAVLNGGESERRSIRGRLGLTDNLPVVLYAPTWRGNLGDVAFDLANLRSALAKLAELPCQVVFRGHYFTEKQVENSDLPVIVASQTVDTSELLTVTDILVTDYSSILFDFLPKLKPIVYFVFDEEEYSEKRGLYFPLEELPGERCRSVDELMASVTRALGGQGIDWEAYERAVARFCPFDDGRATERAVRFLMDVDKPMEIAADEERRISLLFYAGAFQPNGITTSFLNLMRALDPAKYRIVVAVDPDAVERFPERMERFSRLPPWVDVIGRTGRLLADAEERWLISRLKITHSFPEAEMWDIYLGAHAREYRRLFGRARFDAVIQFDGYSPFWSALLLGSGEGAAKAIYLHNDMHSEMEVRFPSLREVFRIYRYYSSLVSVSSTMNNANMASLAGPLNIHASKFRFAENVIDHQEIVNASSEPLDGDLSTWMRGYTVFLTMGRMSPEKDHAKLIDAFKIVHSESADTRLLLLGDGPLRAELERSVRSQGLEAAILFAGQRPNPFPVLRACDCFVLSSNHEGQPMVLLEALALRKPIVATDIEGNRGVLVGRGGELVENSVAGLAKGMLAFVYGEIPSAHFDAMAYQTSAISHFEDAVGVGKGHADLP